MRKHVVSIAFAAALASTGGAVCAQTPSSTPSPKCEAPLMLRGIVCTRNSPSSKVIYPDPTSNTYTQWFGGGFTYTTGEQNEVRRVVDCTLGVMRNEMVIESPVAPSGSKFVQPTADTSVTALTPKAQETIRRNCSSNGLHAEF